MYKIEKDSESNYSKLVKTTAISNISENESRINVVGVVLHKLAIRRCKSNLSASKSRQAVLGFTLRDSATDWVNVSYWGTFSNANHVSSQFSIGDCIVIFNAKAKFKEENSYESRFMVQTTSNYHLHLSERGGSIRHYNFPDNSYAAFLKSSLVCPAAYHTPIYQLIQMVHSRTRRTCERNFNWQSYDNTSVFTFFAVVSEVKSPKTLIMARKRKASDETTESDQQKASTSSNTLLKDPSETVHDVLQLCEVLLLDDTCSCLPLVLWNEEWIHVALTAFVPSTTVLSIVNCPVRYDHYRKGVVASPNSQTLIVISPDCEESNRLSQYAKHRDQRVNLTRGHQNQCFTNESTDDRFSQPLPVAYKTAQPEIYEVPLTNIHNIITIRELKEGKVVAGYACIFALITKLDLDCSNLRYLVTLQCSNCQTSLRSCDPPADFDMPAPGKQIIPSQKYLYAMCNTISCPLSGQRFSWLDKKHVNVDYGTIVHLSDHTGTYYRCLLAGTPMEKLIGHKIEDFLHLSIEERARLKWEICLRRFKVYFWTEQISYNNPTPLIVIIGLEKPNAFEVLQSLKTQ
uniref:MEIOB-like N-terminal domain-containing protein n=1 Tax=Trichobilharzia regenti TaxID=157069 RepID=A0AA85KHE1_TRIRE|nr:unnamed protein product [Trichobilharzia regenti]